MRKWVWKKLMSIIYHYGKCEILWPIFFTDFFKNCDRIYRLCPKIVGRKNVDRNLFVIDPSHVVIDICDQLPIDRNFLRPNLWLKKFVTKSFGPISWRVISVEKILMTEFLTDFSVTKGVRNQNFRPNSVGIRSQWFKKKFKNYSSLKTNWTANIKCSNHSDFSITNGHIHTK